MQISKLLESIKLCQQPMMMIPFLHVAECENTVKGSARWYLNNFSSKTTLYVILKIGHTESTVIENPTVPDFPCLVDILPFDKM